MSNDAKWFKDNPKYNVLIEGHCDEVGTVEYNLALGERRADTTRKYLIDMGVKNIQMTQFLYDNANRPAFARTNLGRIYARYKLWPWNSVRFTRDIVNDAKMQGWNPYTKEFQRYQRLVTANMFSIGLMSMLPYSIFDVSLPSPLNWWAQAAEFLFGDDKEREMVFWGSQSMLLKYPLSPLNELMPSIARIPSGIVQSGELFRMVHGDATWNDVLNQYVMWSAFPFGRFSRDVLRTMDNPAMAPDFLFGLGLHRAQYYANKRRKED